MVTKYQKFGDAYKAEAVKLYRESNQTIAETARNLGLKESTLANSGIQLQAGDQRFSVRSAC